MTPDALLSMAESHLRAGESDEASALVGRAMALLPPEEKRRSRALLERCASQNTMLAQLNLAISLLQGDGGWRDLPRAVGLLEEVIQSEDREYSSGAHIYLAQHHRGDYGARPDLERAFAHWEAAARQGDGMAAFNAALMLEQKLTWLENRHARAIANYRRAVLAGDFQSMTNLALRILHNPEISAYPGEAGDLLRLAAELGDDQAEMAMDVFKGRLALEALR